MAKNKVALQCALLALIIFVAFFIAVFETDKPRADDGYFSAMWVATVSGLDFSGVGKTASQMRERLNEIVDTAYACGFDAIYFQVRPSGDAFYRSAIFPTSRWLSGVEGQSAQGNFDPLEYLCEVAAWRDIEVHAWINPYRLTTSAEQESIIAGRYPHLVMTAENGQKYLNPGNPESITLVADGVRELLEDYNIAGIVFDDYFYPSNSAYDDSAEYEKYGGGKSLADWRRDNTYNLIDSVNKTVMGFADKRFGVSPSGVWQNDSADALGSATKGLQSYSALYADTRKWVKDGIIDYIAPQIYWEHGHSLCDYETLVKWWSDTARGTGVDLYICHAVYKLESGGAWDRNEIAKQLETAKTVGGVSGSAFYRYENIAQNPCGVRDFFESYFGG